MAKLKIFLFLPYYRSIIYVNLPPLIFFLNTAYIHVEKRFLHDSWNIKFNSANEISIEKKNFEKKIFKDNFFILSYNIILI